MFDGGKGIYMPVYLTYRESFYEIIFNQTNIKADFNLFKNTSVYERYLLNAAQFSAAKNAAEVKMTQSLLSKDGVTQSFSRFKSDAGDVANTFHDFWFRVEYDTLIRQVVAGQQFMRYRDDADIYPYWTYLLTNSLHPRDEHLLLVGKTFKIGDPEGDLCFPPNGFNCGCGSQQISDPDTISSGKDFIDDVDKQFRFNPADQGILPKESHSYFEVAANANTLGGKDFGIHGNKKTGTNLKAKGLHMMANIWNDWAHSNHSDHNTITFQNNRTMANVVFTQKAFSTIQKHSHGFEQLPETIKNPQEIWSQWEDTHEQRVTLRCYIKGNYCVMTRDGILINAILVDNVNRFRQGVLI